MHARIARFEGGSAEALQRSIDRINENKDQGPPEGVPAVGFLMLVDKDSGTSLAISFYETEDDLKTGDAALNEMSPPEDEGDAGSRSSVEVFEVGVKAGPAVGG